MNPSYFTEEHQLFREFKRFFYKRSCTAHRKWEKTGTIERFIWKKFGEMGFGIIIRRYMVG
jgi:hypothetical protein